MKVNLILSVFVMLASLTVSAQYTLTSSDVVMSDGYIQSCSYDFTNGESDIIIPSTLDGQTVIGIADKNYGAGVFQYQIITSVQFPTTLEHIGNYAFRQTRIDSVDLSGYQSLKSIGKEAFYDVRKLRYVKLNDCPALTYIGENAFHFCNITYLDLSYCTSLTEIRNQAFVSNYGLDTVLFKGLTALTSIGDNAFMHNHLDALDLNDCVSLKYIGSSAFSGTLTELDLSGCKSLEIIGGGAFSANIDTLNLTGCVALKEIRSGAFLQNPLTNLDLSKCTELTHIGPMAFNWNSIISIDLSKCVNLIEIGKGAFGQNKLEEVKLVGCSSLLSIGDGAFGDQKNDTSVMVKGFLLPTIKYETFTNQWRDGHNNKYGAADSVSDLDTWYHAVVPYTLQDNDVVITDAYIDSCHYNFFFKDLIIPDTLDGQAVIGIRNHNGLYEDGVFQSQDIRSLQFPSTLEYLGSKAFTYNNDLVASDFSRCSKLEEIGERAFYVNSLAILDLSACVSLNVIRESAFNNNLLKEIDFNACVNLKVIEQEAIFQNKLEIIKIEECTKLVKVEGDAFANWGPELIPSYALPTPSDFGASGFVEWKKRYYDDVVVDVDSAEFGANYIARFENPILYSSRTKINFGEVAVGDSVTRKFSMFNHNVSSSTLSFTVPEGFVLTETATDIYYDADKVYEITYVPTQGGLIHADLIISGEGIPETCTINLLAKTAQENIASLIISPSDIEFGEVIVGEQATMSFSILNNHDKSTNIDSVFIPEDINCTVNWTSGLIDANATQVVEITYSPQEGGKINELIIVRSSKAEGDSLVNVSGTSRVLGVDASLSELAIDGVSVSGFLSTTFNFVYVLPAQSTMPLVSATASDENANVSIAQVATLPDTAKVEVTAEDGVTSHTYTISFQYEELSDDVSLLGLEIDGVIVSDFSATTFNYVYVLSAESTMPLVSATTHDENASVSITQVATLPDTAKVEVTAEDGVSKQAYTISFEISASLADTENDVPSLNVFPNPVNVNSSIKISGLGDSSYSMHLQTMSGKTIGVYKGNNDEYELMITNDPGFYLLNIVRANKVETIRIMIIE